MSLNSASIVDLPEEDFKSRPSRQQQAVDGETNPLTSSLISQEDGFGPGSHRSGSSITFDPMSNPSTLLDQSWATKVFYSFFCLEWHDMVFDRKKPLAPQMYYFHNVGLYCHYAAIGIGYGIAGLSLNFCFYYYEGSDNTCANSPSLVFLAWGFKIFYAIATDRYRPYGTRRRVYMKLGWLGAIACTVVLALFGDECTVEFWLGLSIATQAFMMLADVPADGYSVELGQLENEEERGVILSTGQFIRFLATMFAGVLQATLVNGEKTNASDCPVSALNCWSWGLTVGQYYKMLAVIFAVLCIPIFFLREVSSKHIPVHTFAEHGHELWETLKNPTTLFLLIFVSGNATFSQFTPVTYNYVQYTLVGLTNLQAGIQVIFTYLAVAVGVKIFQVFFRNRNWRTTLYLSCGTMQVMGLVWIMVYWNDFGLLNSWFTIFITVNQALAAGVSQVLFSMAVIELAKPGQEAITYELIVSVANAALTVRTISL